MSDEIDYDENDYLQEKQDYDDYKAHKKLDDDADEEYDKFKEDWMDRLDEVMRDSYNLLCARGSEGYYKDNPKRFLEHAVEQLENLTGFLIFNREMGKPQARRFSVGAGK